MHRQVRFLRCYWEHFYGLLRTETDFYGLEDDIGAFEPLPKGKRCAVAFE